MPWQNNDGASVKVVTALTKPYLLSDQLANLTDGSNSIVPLGTLMDEAQTATSTTPKNTPIRFLAAGTFPAVANGSIAVGQRVYSTAGGFVSRIATGVYVGRARTAATATNDIIEVMPPTVRTAVMAQAIVASTVITNTAAETVFSNGSYTFPALEVQEGDHYRVKFQGTLVARNASDTQRIRLRLLNNLSSLNQILLDTTAIALTANDYFFGEFNLFCRIDGTAGVLQGFGEYKTNIGGTVVVGTGIAQSLAVDTTQTTGFTLEATALASAANAGDQIRLDAFEVLRVNPG